MANNALSQAVESLKRFLAGSPIGGYDRGTAKPTLKGGVLSSFINKYDPRRLSEPAAASVALAEIRRQRPVPTPTPTPTPIPSFPILSNTPSQYRSLIESATSQYPGTVSPGVLSRILNKESIGFSPAVISGEIKSPKGAMGIAQFMPGTIEHLANLGFNKGQPIDPYQPREAIPASAFYLNRILSPQLNRSLPLTLAAYNYGIGNVERGVAPQLSKNFTTEELFPYLPLETENYIKSILGASTAR